MQHSDFYIGLEFSASAGFRWRCTDVGSRTIVAIRLDHEDSNWYRGPPYVAEEVVFDETEIKRCHQTDADAIHSAMDECRTSDHPGYPSEDVVKMMKARFAGDGTRYPYTGVLRFDRCTPEGEILHPYCGRKDGDRWIVLIYLPFKKAFSEMPQQEFIALPIVKVADITARAKRPLGEAPDAHERGDKGGQQPADHGPSENCGRL